MKTETKTRKRTPPAKKPRARKYAGGGEPAWSKFANVPYKVWFTDPAKFLNDSQNMDKSLVLAKNPNSNFNYGYDSIEKPFENVVPAFRKIMNSISQYRNTQFVKIFAPEGAGQFDEIRKSMFEYSKLLGLNGTKGADVTGVPLYHLLFNVLSNAFCEIKYVMGKSASKWDLNAYSYGKNSNGTLTGSFVGSRNLTGADTNGHEYVETQQYIATYPDTGARTWDASNLKSNEGIFKQLTDLFGDYGMSNWRSLNASLSKSDENHKQIFEKLNGTDFIKTLKKTIFHEAVEKELKKLNVSPKNLIDLLILTRSGHLAMNSLVSPPVPEKFAVFESPSAPAAPLPAPSCVKDLIERNGQKYSFVLKKDYVSILGATDNFINELSTRSLGDVLLLLLPQAYDQIIDKFFRAMPNAWEVNSGCNVVDVWYVCDKNPVEDPNKQPPVAYVSQVRPEPKAQPQLLMTPYPPGPVMRNNTVAAPQSPPSQQELPETTIASIQNGLDLLKKELATVQRTKETDERIISDSAMIKQKNVQLQQTLDRLLGNIEKEKVAHQEVRDKVAALEKATQGLTTPSAVEGGSRVNSTSRLQKLDKSLDGLFKSIAKYNKLVSKK